MVPIFTIILYQKINIRTVFKVLYRTDCVKFLRCLYVELQTKNYLESEVYYTRNKTFVIFAN